MSAYKRPRQATTPERNNPIVIDLLSDDEGPPAKRQRSIPPPSTHQTSSHVNSIKETLQTPVTPTVRSALQPHSTQSKKSPFKNLPPWLVLSPKLAQGSNQDDPIALDDESGDECSKSTPSEDTRVCAHKQNHGSSQIPSNNPVATRSNPDKGSTTSDIKSEFKLHIVKPLIFDTAADTAESPTYTDSTKSSSRVPGLSAQKSCRDSITVKPPAKIKGKFRAVPSPLLQRLSTASTKDKTTVATPSERAIKPSFFQHQSDREHRKLSQAVARMPPPSLGQLRKEMQDKLKISADFAISNPVEVERVLGKTGFSASFLPQDTFNDLRRPAQPKKRYIDRGQIPLDIPGPISVQNPRPQKRDFVHPRDQVRTILTNRFSENFMPPLTFSNNINNRCLNGKFQFIERNIIRDGVRIIDNLKRDGCSLTCGSGECSEACSCLQINHDEDEEEAYDDHSTKPGISYRRLSDGKVVLTNDQLGEDARHAEIFECDEGCPCTKDCINRVVQNGRTLPLEIFETGRYGFGVRSSQRIVRGQFIEVYLGEVITEAELTLREEALATGGSSYVYSLDWFHQDKIYHIDGRNFGSAMRFVNHSCEPNARTIPVMNQSSTREIYDLAFFAIKDIAPGTEITIDYSPQLRSSSADESDDEVVSSGEYSETEELGSDGEILKCLCGSAKCRRTPWQTETLEKWTMRRKRIKHLN